MTFYIATDYPGMAYDGEPTFAGLLQNYFVEHDTWNQNIGISKNWNERTAASCLHDYERRILSSLALLCGKEKPAHELTGEIYEQVLQDLSKKHHYSDSTLAHYRHLIFLVYQAGVEHGHYPDTLFWEDVFDAEAASDAEKEAWQATVMTRLRKSFSVEEEMKICQWFRQLDPRTASGEEIGLILMFTLGVRNNEACGANFSSIHPLAYYPDTFVFDMVQSTKKDSSEVKSGGKTRNAPRTLLMLEPVYDFLECRKEYLSDRINAGAIQLPDTMRNAEDLPLVCRGSNYTKRARSSDLAVAAKELFKRIGIDRSELAVLFQILCSAEFQQMKIEEKEPTTYLFRRNCATHLYQLGFSPAEIQYWMGHEIEDPFMRRSFFTDPDQLQALREKWERHPILTLLASDPSEAETISSLPFYREDPQQSRFHLIEPKSRKLLISAEFQEPMSDISFSVHSNTPGLSANSLMIPRRTEHPRSAAITKVVNRVYREHSHTDEKNAKK